MYKKGCIYEAHHFPVLCKECRLLLHTSTPGHFFEFSFLWGSFQICHILLMWEKVGYMLLILIPTRLYVMPKKYVKPQIKKPHVHASQMVTQTYLLYKKKYYSGLKTQIQATLNEIIR